MGKTVFINGIEVPKPLTVSEGFALPVGTTTWHVKFTNESMTQVNHFKHTRKQMMLVKAGMMHLSKADAKQHANALRAVSQNYSI